MFQNFSRFTIHSTETIESNHLDVGQKDLLHLFVKHEQSHIIGTERFLSCACFYKICCCKLLKCFPQCGQISGSHLLSYLFRTVGTGGARASPPFLPLKKENRSTKGQSINVMPPLIFGHSNVPDIIDYSLKLDSRPVHVFTEHF